MAYILVQLCVEVGGKESGRECACMYVCVCIYVCKCVYARACMYVCVRVRTCVCACMLQEEQKKARPREVKAKRTSQETAKVSITVH